MTNDLGERTHPNTGHSDTSNQPKGNLMTTTDTDGAELRTDNDWQAHPGTCPLCDREDYGRTPGPYMLTLPHLAAPLCESCADERSHLPGSYDLIAGFNTVYGALCLATPAARPAFIFALLDLADDLAETFMPEDNR